MTSSKIVALSKVNHASLTFTPLADYSFASERNSVPLLPIEMDQASRCFPIFFPDSRNPTPHALLGLGKKNIFVNDDGTWNAPYLPLIFANYPFSIVKASFKKESNSDETESELALAIDESAKNFRGSEGTPLFDENREPSELLKRVKETMISQYSSYQSMSKSLAELNLHDSFSIDPISIHYNGKNKSIAGIRIVNRKKIFSLPEATLGHWVKVGLMDLLYAHWHSFLNLPILLDDPSCPTAIKTDS